MKALASRFQVVVSNEKAVLLNAAGIPRISDEEHLARALACGKPHSYISVRAGRLVYEGEDGTGHINAITMHKKIININPPVDISDLNACYESASFRSAIAQLGQESIPQAYKDVLGAEFMKEIFEPKRAAWNLFHI